MQAGWSPSAAALSGALLGPRGFAPAQAQGSNAPWAKPPAAPAPAPAKAAELLRIDKQASHENGLRVIVNTLAALDRRRVERHHRHGDRADASTFPQSRCPCW